MEKEMDRLARSERMAQAGGQLIGAAFALIGGLFSQKEGPGQDTQLEEKVRQRLSDCMERDERGRLKMTLTLPDETYLDQMAKSLARIMR